MNRGWFWQPAEKVMRKTFVTAVSFVAVALSCTAAVAQSQQDMNAEEGARFSEADKAMNAVYDRLMAKISPAGQAALRDAQRSWLRFRDQECDFETLGSSGGSIRPMIVCPEGNAGCGNQ
jgi:uncharacterized protein YecT (DUF1311 family)